MSEIFKRFTMFQPVQTTTTSTTWSGLQAIDPRCYGCIYSYVKHGTLICDHASRIVANNIGVRECVSYVKRDAHAERLRGEG